MIIADIFNRVCCGAFQFVPVLGIKRIKPLHLFVPKKTKQQQIWMWLGERFVFHSSMCSIIRKMCIYYRKVHDFYPFIYFPWYFQVFHDITDPVLYFLHNSPPFLNTDTSRGFTVTCASIHAAEILHSFRDAAYVSHIWLKWARVSPEERFTLTQKTLTYYVAWISFLKAKLYSSHLLLTFS